MDVQRRILLLLTEIQVFEDKYLPYNCCYKYTVYAHSLVKSKKSFLPLTSPICESQVEDKCTVECPSTCNTIKTGLKHGSFIKQH